MKLFLFFLLLPLASISQTFEKVLQASFFQLPAGLVETPSGYYMISNESDSLFDSHFAKITHINNNGLIVKYFVFDKPYSERLTNIINLNDSILVIAGYKYENENDYLKITFRLINTDLKIIHEITIKTELTNTDTSEYFCQAVMEYTKEDCVYFALGYDNFYDNNDGVIMVKLDANLSVSQKIEYKNLPYRSFSAPASLITLSNPDSLMLFMPGYAYILDTTLTILDTLPDFTRILNEDGSFAIDRPVTAGWISDKMIIGGTNYIYSYNSDLTIDSVIDITVPQINCYGGYYSCLAVNDKYAFASSMVGTADFYYGLESKIRIVKVDKSLNIEWDRFYKENDGYYYFVFNTLATSDGGCLIAATRNNLETQGERIDIYLLKVDSLGNYTPLNVSVVAENQVKLFPNPGSDEMQVNINENEKGNFKLYNLNGQLIYCQYLVAKNNTLYLPQLLPGIYIYEFVGQNGESIRGKWVHE